MGAGRIAVTAHGALLALSLIAAMIAGRGGHAAQSDSFSELLASTAAGNLDPVAVPEPDSFAGLRAIDSSELRGTKAADFASDDGSVLVGAISVRIGPQDAVIYLRTNTVLAPDDEVDALLSVATTAGPVEKAALLAEDDIASLIVGNSLSGYSQGGWWTEYYAPDGTIRGYWRSSRYHAKWSVEGKSICFDYPGQSRYCLTYSVVGDQVYFYRSDGSGGSRAFKVLPGNPLNL